MIKVLVIGSNGQLGSELKFIQNGMNNLSFEFLDLPDIDITNKESVTNVYSEIKPSYIINCAAYTAVDKAEVEKDIAFKVNATGPGILSEQAELISAKLFHISTDFVFDGRSFSPYTESDEINPISIYGKSKADGEIAVLDNSSTSIVIRTSWLYSKFGNNFVKTMIRLGNKRENLNVVFDQIGSPTWARDLADCIVKIIESDEEASIDKRIFHFSNEGVASWYDFAHEIMKLNNLPCNVCPILSKEYPTPAQRPAYSVMDKSHIKKKYNISIPHWKNSLQNCLKEINND